MGSGKGGVDNHPQSDWAGDRGEWDLDNSGGGRLYVGRFDGRIHLYGAEWGCWRIDQTARYFQGYDRSWQNKAPKSFATVKYTDTDDNGFLDCIEYDLDGDRVFEFRISNTAISPVYIKRCPARCGRMRSLPERRPNVSD